MPSADFCSAVRPPFDSLSPIPDTKQISWGKLGRLPCTVAESTLRTLMDMDFAVSCPLVRHWRLVSGSCPSTRTFDPCFFRTPPRGGSPCIITRPSPPSGWPEDFHLQTAEHAQHTTKPLARQTLRVTNIQALFFASGACIGVPFPVTISLNAPTISKGGRQSLP
jgi:hypothetical protein